MKKLFSHDEILIRCLITWTVGFCIAMGIVALQVLASVP